MANTARLAAWRFNTVSLIKIVLCFYLALVTPLSYAIDPITGAWTANAAASAAFGGGGSGAASALTAAVEASAGAGASAAAAAAAAAAVAGAGVFAFCAASAIEGSNFCCSSGNALGAALSGGGLKCGSGPVASPGTTTGSGSNLVTAEPFDPKCAHVWNGNLNNSNLPPGISCTSRNYALEASYSSPSTSYRCYNILLEPPYTSSQKTNTTGCVALPAPTTRPATAEEVADAAASNAASRSAAAAATAAPSVAAAEAAAAASTAAPRTAEAECAAKGMKHGTFNGTVFCVGTGGTAANPDAPGEAGTAEGEGTGTETGDGTTPNTGNPPVSPPLPAFCTYAQTLCNWLLWTKEEPAAANASQNKVDIKDRETGDIPGLSENIDTSRIQWAQICPAPIGANFSLMGQSVGLSYKFDVVCDFAAKFRPYVIGLSYLTGAYIVMGLNRTRSE